MRAVSLAPVFVVCATLSAGAQGVVRGASTGEAKECLVHMTGVFVNGIPTTTMQTAGQDTTWVGGGVDAKCEGTDQRVLADSAEHYTDRKILILIGRVHYTEERLKLDADRITYVTGEERLLAEGNVVGLTSTGTRFVGPHAEYLRPAPGIRAKSHLTAEPRSIIQVSPKDAGGGSKDPVNIQADRIVMDNDSLVYAKGIVVIERPDLLSTSDSAFLDDGAEFARLTRNPKVVGRGDRHFELEGDIIDIYSKNREVARVKSLGHAASNSDDVSLKADTIDLRIAKQKLEQAFAWGRSRAHAESKDQKITADSIDVLMPDQTLRSMRAIGRAIAESQPDSAKIVSKQLDFLHGDTIVAKFDSVAPTDTVRQPSIREIIAYGRPGQQAQSFYQVAPGGAGKTGTPNYNYGLADSITVTFRKRLVHDVKLLGHVSGYYYEAVADSSRSPALTDSTKATASGKTPQKTPQKTPPSPAKKPTEARRP